MIALAQRQNRRRKKFHGRERRSELEGETARRQSTRRFQPNVSSCRRAFEIKEAAMYIAYSIGIVAFSIYNNESLYTLDSATAKIISSGNDDSGSSAAIVTFLFFIAAPSYIGRGAVHARRSRVGNLFLTIGANGQCHKCKELKLRAAPFQVF